MEKWFNVGKIVNTHGLLGEVRVISSTDFPEKRYKVGNTLYLFRDTEKNLCRLSSGRIAPIKTLTC